MRTCSYLLAPLLSIYVVDAFVTPAIPQQHVMRVPELSMAKGNSVDRLARVFRSNVNKWVSTIEDPEKVILQATSDMQSDLLRIRQAYAEGMGTRRRLERQRSEAERTAAVWHERAQLAVTRGKDTLAKEALGRRQVVLDQAVSLQQQIDSLALDQLHQAMMALEGKIREATLKKEQLIARAKTAKNTASVNDMLSGLTGKTSMDAFGRMEEKVLAMEAAAEASAEMSLLGASSSSSNSDGVSLEAEFLLLEQKASVEDELEAMKQDLKRLSGSMEEAVNEPVMSPYASIPVR